jgi:predicted transcriptional regulator
MHLKAMKVLLSIKPEYANKIFTGEKKYEFRRTIFKNKQIKKVIVYASSPISKVIGEFDIDIIISEEPSRLWEITQQHSGISEDFFYSYFNQKEIAHAIKVKSFKKYDDPLCIRKDFNALPPQSFMYL